MKLWIDLYAAQGKTRGLSSNTWSGDLRKLLVTFAAAGFCDRSVEGRFTYKQVGKLVEWSIRDGGSPTPIALRNLTDLASAELSLMALADRDNHLHQFTAMVEGRRADGSAWSLAVHFEDDRETKESHEGDRKGTGACGHAAFHCHVGPGLNVGPKVRVPLPAFGPVEALQWVLSQLVPTPQFEPAPWSSVTAAMKKASP